MKAPSDDDSLRVFAEQHIAHEIGMFVKLPRLRRRGDPVVKSAVYESFLVHLRNLDTFIRSVGRDDEAKAKDYVAGWKSARPVAVAGDFREFYRSLPADRRLWFAAIDWFPNGGRT